jgi:hypothetical protein
MDKINNCYEKNSYLKDSGMIWIDKKHYFLILISEMRQHLMQKLLDVPLNTMPKVF